MLVSVSTCLIYKLLLLISSLQHTLNWWSWLIQFLLFLLTLTLIVRKLFQIFGIKYYFYIFVLSIIHQSIKLMEKCRKKCFIGMAHFHTAEQFPWNLLYDNVQLIIFFYIFRYALLVGHPPFETATLKETYIRITENRFSIPDWISPQARNLITKCLTHEPELRPSLDNILMDEFFTCGHYPNRLSPYCCTTAPRYQANSSNQNSQRASRCVPQTNQYVLVVLEDSVC